MDKYYEAAKAGRSARITATFGKRWATMITSRGCPYQCVFCSIHIHMGRKWRPRSPENVVDEIEELVNKYDIELISFEDDNMTLNRDRMVRICELIKERGLDFEWDTPNGVRADTLDEDLLKRMKETGCKQIYVSPESGNQHVVNDIIKKRLDLKKVEETVKLCKKIGIRVDCFFVIGLIGETKENIRETINFARKLKKLGAASVIFSIATPYYGTELYEKAKELGYLKVEGDEYMHTFEPKIETPEFTLDEIKRFYLEGLKINPTLFCLSLLIIMSAMRKITHVIDG